MIYLNPIMVNLAVQRCTGRDASHSEPVSVLLAKINWIL